MTMLARSYIFRTSHVTPARLQSHHDARIALPSHQHCIALFRSCMALAEVVRNAAGTAREHLLLPRILA